MAKKPELTNPFAKTADEPATPQIDNSDLDTGNIKPMSAGMRQGEIDALGTIANELGIARNAVMRIGLRHFIKAWRAGQVKHDDLFQTETITKVKMK